MKVSISFQIFWIIDLNDKFRFMWQIINLSCLIFSLLCSNILFIQSVCLTQNQMSSSCFTFKAALALLLPLHNNETFIELCLPVVKNIVINIYFIFIVRWLSLTEWITNFSYILHTTKYLKSFIFPSKSKLKWSLSVWKYW